MYFCNIPEPKIPILKLNSWVLLSSFFRGPDTSHCLPLWRQLCFAKWVQNAGPDPVVVYIHWAALHGCYRHDAELGSSGFALICPFTSGQFLPSSCFFPSSSTLFSFHPIWTKKLSGKFCLLLYVCKITPSAELLPLRAITIAIRVKIRVFAHHGNTSSKSNLLILMLPIPTFLCCFRCMELPTPRQF